MNILENAKPENRFYCADGTVLRNAEDLAKKLKTISVQAFHHHVTPSRNDFHNWVRDVYQDIELANELLKAKLPFEAAAIVRKHVAKALRARQEIEKAIEQVQETAIKATKAGESRQRKKRKKKQQKITAKKRKVNKKRNKRKNGKVVAKKTAAASKKRARSRRISKLPNKQVKKRMKRWLNWLKLVPEL